MSRYRATLTFRLSTTAKFDIACIILPTFNQQTFYIYI